jgi:diphthine synthase
MLYLIGLGLQDEKDLSLKSLEILKKCSQIYFEGYTSRLNFDLKKLEDMIGKQIFIASRDMLENKMDEFILNAKNKDVALLVIGDPLMATTHNVMILEAEKKKIESRVIHNASVLNAIADTGLSLYNFGKIASIPFENKDIISPVEIANVNNKLGMHTLFLLDLKNGKYMSINDGLTYLLDQGLKDELAIGCAGLGRKDQEIKAGKMSKLIQHKFSQEPGCIILLGKMHFLEEEAIERWKI